MFDRFAESARHVVQLAQEQAQLYGHGRLDAGHLLLGALDFDGDDLAVEIDAVQVALLRQLGSADPKRPRKGALPLTPAARQVFERMPQLAADDGRALADDLDMLTAVLEEPGVWWSLTDGGVDVAEIRASVVVVRQQRTAP